MTSKTASSVSRDLLSHASDVLAEASVAVEAAIGHPTSMDSTLEWARCQLRAALVVATGPDAHQALEQVRKITTEVVKTATALREAARPISQRMSRIT